VLSSPVSILSVPLPSFNKLKVGPVPGEVWVLLHALHLDCLVAGHTAVARAQELGGFDRAPVSVAAESKCHQLLLSHPGSSDGMGREGFEQVAAIDAGCAAVKDPHLEMIVDNAQLLAAGDVLW